MRLSDASPKLPALQSDGHTPSAARCQFDTSPGFLAYDTAMRTTGPEFFALQSALLGPLSIECELGREGMGIVYLARDVQLERSVAVTRRPISER